MPYELARDLTQRERDFLVGALLDALPGRWRPHMQDVHAKIAMVHIARDAPHGGVRSVSLCEGMWWLSREGQGESESKPWPTGEGWKEALVAEVMVEVMVCESAPASVG